jgi:hypothetical protein
MNDSSRSAARHGPGACDGDEVVVEASGAVAVLAGREEVVVPGADGPALAEGVLLDEPPQDASRSAAEHASRAAFTLRVSPLI